LKNNFIANAGITIVLVITTAMAATIPIMARDAWIRCLVIEYNNIFTLIDSIDFSVPEYITRKMI
jgi:hypothetical protein